MKLSNITAIICFLVTIAACKKEDKKSPTARTLQNAVWQISASEIIKYNGQDTSIDYYSYWRACEQDDITIYNEDGSGTSEEYTNKCPEDSKKTEFSWQLQENDTQLKISLKNGKFSATGNNTIVFDLLEVTDNQLRLKASTNISGTPATTIETYKNIK